MRVLVVDDIEDIRLCLRMTFFLEGFEVDEASDGPSAMKLALERDYDILITDYNMPPSFDGLSLIKKIHVEKPTMPVLLLTANTTVNSEVIKRENSLVTVLYKPVETARLLAEVRRILAG